MAGFDQTLDKEESKSIMPMIKKRWIIWKQTNLLMRTEILLELKAMHVYVTR